MGQPDPITGAPNPAAQKIKEAVSQNNQQPQSVMGKIGGIFSGIAATA